MDQQRKEIVMKEIEYWKKNRLLPEQYCNYLLTLYSEGTHETREQSQTLKRQNPLFLQILFLVFLPVLFLVIYFTELPYGLQTSINLLLTIVSILFTFFYIKKNQLYHTFFMIISFLFLFLISIETVNEFFKDYLFVIEITVVFHSLLWFLAGRLLKKRYLTISGLVCLVVLLAFFIGQFIQF